MSDNHDLNYYLGGLGTLFQEVEDLVRDTADGDPGWSILLDVNRVPTKGLPWLAQFVGVTLDYNTNDSGLRQQVRAHERWGRGTPSSLLGAAYKWIPYGSALYISERNPNPYHITWTMVDQPSAAALSYLDLFQLYGSYHQVYSQFEAYVDIYDGGRGNWDTVIEILNKGKPIGIQYTFVNTTTILYLALYILLTDYQEVYDNYLTYQLLYDDAFPDISLGVPTFQQLVSTRYYRNIFNQFESYSNVWDSYVMY